MAAVMGQQGQVLGIEDLRRISGRRNASAIRRWARVQGIKLLDGAAGPWTTIDAVNQAMGLNHSANDPGYGADIL